MQNTVSWVESPYVGIVERTLAVQNALTFFQCFFTQVRLEDAAQGVSVRDQRDRRDDIRDFQQQINRAERQAAILQTMKTYNFSYEAGAIEKAVANKKLIQEFLDTLVADFEATKRELNEDLRESREDRRERRDDRQERNERTVKRRIRN